MEKPTIVTTGYELADEYLGQDVRVFYSDGTILTGKVLIREGKFILLKDKRRPRPAMVNLDGMRSIT